MTNELNEIIRKLEYIKMLFLNGADKKVIDKMAIKFVYEYINGE